MDGAGMTPDGPITPSVVRYIKLGRGGGWERECLDDGIARFGYGTQQPARFEAAIAGRWAELTSMFLDEGKAPGTATRFTRDVQHFFRDETSTLWITFSGQQLWWAFLEPDPPQRHPDGHGTFRRTMGGWRGTDLLGDPLTIDRLAGSLTKMAAYRSTTFALDPRTGGYVVRRINGERSPEVERAVLATAAMRASARELVGLLEPRDFELLVDLIFSTSGWRRLGAVGGTQKTLDLDIQLPSTGERAFVQVKSATTNAELAEYVAHLDDLGPYRRMFFVYHAGSITEPDDDRVVVLGPERLAELVVDAGLVGWLVGKVS
jgi:hypothetical protein